MVTDDGSEDDEFDGLATFTEWSSGKFTADGDEPPNYDGADDCERNWHSLKADRAGGATFGSLVFLAKLGGYQGPTFWRSPNDMFGGAYGPPGARTKDDGETPDKPLNAADIAAGDFPRAVQLWADFLLKDHANVLDGDGGIGKTLLLIMIAVAVAAGKPLLGHGTIQMPVLLVLCEDDYGETKARLAAVCDSLDVRLEDLPLRVWCRPGQDSTIAIVEDGGVWKPGPFMKPLCQELEAMGPCFLGLDTISDIAVMDENRKAAVNAFAKQVLGHLSAKYAVTSLTTRHPSKASMADGSFYAGATSAKASFRNVLTMKRKGDDGRGEPTLRVSKSNYGLTGETDLFFFDGVFKNANSIEQEQKRRIEQNSVRETVRGLRANDVAVVQTHGHGHKPADIAKIIKQEKGLDLTAKQVVDHLKALERDGEIHWVPNSGGKKRRPASYEMGPRSDTA